MPDILDATGLTVDTAAEITSVLVTGLQAIYGADINVDQNSPDGQVVGIITQQGVDIRELAVSVNSSFDPDQAVGTILDQRVAINNIQRQGGTYTIQPIDIVASTTVPLQGLDANFASPIGTGYTVQDSSGNLFILEDSTTVLTGTTTLNFRAQQIGAVNVPVNTINVPTTIIFGITSVNNSSAAISVGQNQETDAQLRTRRQQSVAIASTGYLNGLLGTVKAITGVVDAELHENVTNATDSNGIPAHGIWLIVDGGANTDIGNAIYAKKSYGANMKGAVMVPITTASGDIFTALFDRPTAETLYIQFNIQKTTTINAFDTAAIAQYIVANKSYMIGQYADAASLTTIAQAAINQGSVPGVPTDVKVSIDNTTWLDYVTPSTLDKEFTISTAHIFITIL
jgi:hypothetical protein